MMDPMFIEVGKILLQYGLAPIAAICWWMFKKHEFRLDLLEKRTNDLEKTVVRIEAQLNYIAEAVKRIDDRMD